MTTPASRLTSKYQATIPLPVRDALGLRSGDTVQFDIGKDGSVRMRKQASLDAEFARALNGTLASEWSSGEDERAYREL